MTLDELLNMTLDELLNIGNEAADDVASKAERMGLCPSVVEMGRARVRAIVEALRDEMAINSCACKFWLDDILASDGVEARPVCPTCKGAGALFGPYDPSDRTPCPECTPAAAPSAQSETS